MKTTKYFNHNSQSPDQDLNPSPTEQSSDATRCTAKFGYNMPLLSSCSCLLWRSCFCEDTGGRLIFPRVQTEDLLMAGSPGMANFAHAHSIYGTKLPWRNFLIKWKFFEDEEVDVKKVFLLGKNFNHGVNSSLKIEICTWSFDIIWLVIYHEII